MTLHCLMTIAKSSPDCTPTAVPTNLHPPSPLVRETTILNSTKAYHPTKCPNFSLPIFSCILYAIECILSQNTSTANILPRHRLQARGVPCIDYGGEQLEASQRYVKAFDGRGPRSPLAAVLYPLHFSRFIPSSFVVLHSLLTSHCFPSHLSPPSSFHLAIILSPQHLLHITIHFDHLGVDAIPPPTFLLSYLSYS